MARQVVSPGVAAGADEALALDSGGERSSPASSAVRSEAGFSWRLWAETGAAFAGVYLAVRLLTRYPGGDWLAGGVLVLASIALASALGRIGFSLPVSDRLVPRPRDVGSPRPPGILTFFATLATVITVVRSWEVGLGPAGWDVGGPWLLSMVLVGLVAWWPSIGPWLASRRTGGPRAWTWPPVAVWAPWAAMLLVGAVPRMLLLDRYPALITGDEGEYLAMAVSARDGTMANPFSTGWLEVPLLYPAVGGWIAAVAGGDLVAHRLIGALVGTLGVLAAWRYGRYVVGSWPAAAGAGLMATLPFHLVFSRSAMNHVLDPTTLVLTLLFLYRAVRTNHRGEAWLSGAMAGIGLYGYWNARAFPLIVVGVLAVMMTDRRVGMRNVLRHGLWSAIGYITTAGPLLVIFAMHHNLYWGRIDFTTSNATAGWGEDPIAAGRRLGNSLREAIFFPFLENFRIWWRHDAPFLGWPIALLVAIGGAAWLAGLIRAGDWRASAWLLVPWAVLTSGLGLTAPIESQRSISLIPIWMLLAGCGVVAVVRWLAWPVRRDRLVRKVLVGGLVAAIGLSSLAWVIQPERLLHNWGDPRTLAAWELGWRLANSDDPSAPVLYAGAPYMFIEAWANLRFIAPQANVQDHDEGESDQVPAVPDGGLLVFGPERVEEMCSIAAANPGYVVAEARASNGTLLYVSLVDGQGIAGWPVGTSPEGTTFAVPSPSPCLDPSGS